MGYLVERYLKDKSKKYYVYIALDIALIFTFIWFGLTMKWEFEAGAKFILQNVPAYCTNYTLYADTLEHYDVVANYNFMEGLRENMNFNVTPIT